MGELLFDLTIFCRIWRVSNRDAAGAHVAFQGQKRPTRAVLTAYFCCLACAHIARKVKRTFERLSSRKTARIGVHTWGAHSRGKTARKLSL